MEKMDPESPMVEHHLDNHEGIPKVDVQLEIVKQFKKPLERQIYEGVKINQSKATLMNRKGECGQICQKNLKV